MRRAFWGALVQNPIAWMRTPSILAVLLGLTTLGCVRAPATAHNAPKRLSVEERLKALEARSQTQHESLEGLTLRVDSVSTGLDRLTERLNQAIPPTAQWIKLEKGSVLRWYIDEQLQSVYGQFMSFQPATSKLELALSTREGSQVFALAVGQGVEVKLNDGKQARAFTLRTHTLLQLADQSWYAQVSLVEGSVPPP